MISRFLELPLDLMQEILCNVEAIDLVRCRLVRLLS